MANTENTKTKTVTLPTPLNWDEIKVGDTICYKRYITYGWNIQYRHPEFITTIITRITPKRTKIVCADGAEIEKRNEDIYPVTEATVLSTSLAKMFHFCSRNYDEITPEILSKLSQNDLRNVYHHLLAIIKIIKPTEEK